MKGLRKYLTPFAPDQSGATSVLYAIGGILVIIDAGGCVGNICGFDEPRWQGAKSAIFSAGLRDMDAILGRDELLVQKLVMAAEQIDAKFVALIGTPVPAVIGTDYHALMRMAERKLKMKILPIDTNGMDLYDKGASKAYFELVKAFAGQKEAAKTHSVGILGCDPLDMSDAQAEEKLRSYYLAQGYEQCFLYGSAETLDWIENAGQVEKNIVVSPAGLEAARYLRRKFGTPYEVEDPLGMSYAEKVDMQAGQQVLVVDQQVTAGSIRKVLEEKGAKVTVASWFMMDPELKREGDVRLREEDDFTELAESGRFDIIIADPVQERMAGAFQGRFLPKNQFSLSGKQN